MIDSGIAKTAAVNSAVVYSTSLIAGLPSDDGYGHGTHIAGIIAERSSQISASFTRTFKGMAPCASLLNFRVLASNGMAPTATSLPPLTR